MIGTGTFTTTPLMRQYVNDVLDSGRLSYGLYSQKFEQQFSQLHGCAYGVLSNSGTSSLLVALQTLKELHGWQDGDEVIVPALTFVATVNVVLQLGLKPVLVDVEPDYYGIDTKLIERTITKKTRAIILVHTFGQPCDIFNVFQQVIENYLASEEIIKVIADSCESMFVQHNNYRLGQLAHITCFSTYIAHLLTTGVGGVAITDNPDYARTMRSLVNHGMSYDDLSSGDNSFSPVKTRRDFIFDRVGHSFRITELESALGLAQLTNWSEMIAKRQLNASYLTKQLSPLEDRLQLPQVRPHTEHSWMMYPMVCRQDNVRDKLTRYLEEKGIETRRMLPLTCQPVYKEWCNEADYPAAKWINENGYYVGVHQGLTIDDLDYLVEAHVEFFQEYG